MAHPSGTTALTASQVVSLSRKGSYKNYFDTRKHYEAGTCPFCLNNGLDTAINEIMHQTGHWLVWEAPAALRPKSMQNGLLRHIMVVSIDHIESHFDLSKEAWNDLFDVMAWVKQKFGIEACFMLGRSGDPLYTGATELHFSFQLKVPDRTMPNRKRTAEVFSKTEDEEIENVARGDRFSELYQAGITPAQFKDLLEGGIYADEGLLLQNLDEL